VKIFISYSRADGGDVARHVYKHLLEDGYDVFIDKENSRFGPWTDIIEQNIAMCNIFMVIVTKRALESNSVEHEVSHAQATNRIIVPLVCS